MSSSLASRLGDIPGVASVVVDLDGFGRGIDVRLEPGADEALVMERLRALLAAYGVRSERRPRREVGRAARHVSDLGVDVTITPTDGGARIEVATGLVRSSRVVSADPMAVAQGLADVWCQVIGRVPIEIVSVEVGEDGSLAVVGNDGGEQVRSSRAAESGWIDALTGAIGDVIGATGRPNLELAVS
ncbi:MAG TPA: hypothetical protein VFZ80_07110 [Acidimicrobiia bacterium]